MLLASFVWTIESAWVVPYGVFWIWLLTVAVRLVMGRDVPAASAAARGRVTGSAAIRNCRVVGGYARPDLPLIECRAGIAQPHYRQ